jgi:endonuclease/exonuclease/phosphatase family metal-dependent hydrolase
MILHGRASRVKPKTRMTAPPQTPTRDARVQESGVERGSFAPDDLQSDRSAGGETTEMASQLVVTTYNIRYAVGSHLISGSLLRRLGVSRPGRRARLVVGHIRRAARLLSDGAKMPPADIVALQEADRGTIRAGGQNVARALAEALRMNYVRAGTPTPADVEPKKKRWWLDFEEHIRPGEEGDTGVAMLSRFPLRGAARIELPWSECPWRPRLALAASVPFGARRLHIFDAHIDTHATVEGQLEQHRAVLAHVDALSEGEPVVLLGDFNTLTRRARDAARSLLETHGFETPMPTDTSTWRSGLLRYHFDWIFVRGVRVRRWGVARVRGISDHWPVWAEIEDERFRFLTRQ